MIYFHYVFLSKMYGSGDPEKVSHDRKPTYNERVNSGSYPTITQTIKLLVSSELVLHQLYLNGMLQHVHNRSSYLFLCMTILGFTLFKKKFLRTLKQKFLLFKKLGRRNVVSLTSVRGKNYSKQGIHFYQALYIFMVIASTVYAGKSELWVNIIFILFYRKESKVSLSHLQD